jgi:hypothetical protein
MDDKELIELAAKAAGIDVKYSKAFDDFTIWPTEVRWDPLNDDGDCARMEAALLLRVTFNDGWVSVGHESFGNEAQCEFFSDYEGDRNKARRAASVFAAASIGNATP